MLTRVDFTNRRGETLALPLEDISSGYVVAGIEGLGPVKATLVSSSFASMDGAQYHSSRREPRNLKVNLELEPDYILTSVEDLRNRLYAFFMTKSSVTAGFHMTGNRFVNILGQVESCEPPLFTQEPSVDISLMCFDPDFYDPILGLFQWGTTGTATEGLVNYLGTVDTGLELVLYINRTLPSFTFYIRTEDGVTRSMILTYSFVAGDVLRINTNSGSKSAILTRGGVATSLLYSLDPTSAWLTFQPGKNYVRILATGVEIPFDINYTLKYGGL